MRYLSISLDFFLLMFLLSCTTTGATQIPDRTQETATLENQVPQAPSFGQDAQLTEAQYLRLTRGVFEVVLPRIEDKDVVYKEKLPEHLLPFKIRKSPYRGIGTAFAVGPNRFVSAAHVFDLDQPTLVGPVAMRDTEGKVYAIDKVTRYSQHRDLIEFTLKNPPKNVEPLKISTKSRMGQYVLTVGNALGDGIVTRSGFITSFTPEAVDGEWDDIRYSAPASPGNSGGPLLDKNLDVLGIVVRRTQNENLNFAIPISELLKTTNANFFLRDVKIEQFNKQLSRDWKFAHPVPATMEALSKAAAASYVSFQDKIYNDFQKEYKGDVFPSDPKLSAWARDSWSMSLAGFIQKDNNDKWITQPVDWSITKLEKYRSLVTVKGGERAETTLFMLERPAKTKLSDFYSDGKSVLDTFIKHIGLNRPFAGRRIQIESYGKPENTSAWTDSFGRKWVEWEWNTAFDDRSLQLSCLPMPAGLFCLFNTDPYSQKMLSRITTRRALNRLVVDIYGKLRDWKEWESIKPEWKHSMLPKIELVNMKGKTGGISWKVGSYSGKLTQKEFDDESELALSFTANPKNIFDLSLRSVQIAEKDGDIQMGVGTNYRPDDSGNPSYREVWDKMLERRAPYNGQPQIQGKHSLIVSLMGKNMGPKTEKLNFITCGVLASVGEEKIKNICSEYSKSVNVGITR